MNCSEIVEVSISCDTLYGYLMDESLLLYSEATQNVYGLEKGDASLFLQIDELISKCSYLEIRKQFPTVDTITMKEMYDLVSGKEIVDFIEYEADMECEGYVKDDLSRVHYQVDDIVFSMHYPDETFFKHLHPVFSYLHIDVPTGTTIVSVDFIKSGSLWEVQLNNDPAEMAVPKERLATYLQEKIMTFTYQAQPYLISLHAASVEKNGKVVVMPAVAESGKTTLTATLLQHGFRLFSDEVTSLDYNGHVHPLPFCMNIKEGSWQILSNMYPQLSKRDIHSRFDDQNIRFLPPENMHKGRQKATHIIFPKYIPDSKTSLISIGATEALLKINKASYQVQNNMDKNKFELILENLIILPKSTLEYSDLDEAIDIINGLI